METYTELLRTNSFIKVVILAIILDVILGLLRACKDKRLNSTVGINGAIRKIAMIMSVAILMAMDMIAHFDMLFIVPENYIKQIGIEKLGTCEFFCLLFILFEMVSILKNMCLCGLPVPNKLQKMVEKFLDEMTEELPEQEESEVD